MSTLSLFEIGTRKGYRFTGAGKGALTIEDLWQLPLQSSTGAASLNSVAQECNRQLKAQSEENFVTEQSSASTELQQKFDIVMRIISIRKEENAAKLRDEQKKDELAQLDALIVEKQQGELKGKSLDELLALRKSLAG